MEEDLSFDALIGNPNSQIEQVLDHPDVSDQVAYPSVDFLNFLTKEPVLSRLIDYMLTPTEAIQSIHYSEEGDRQREEDKIKKYSYLSFEIFNGSNRAFVRKIFAHGLQFKILDFLDKPAEVRNPVSDGYFLTVLGKLFDFDFVSAFESVKERKIVETAIKYDPKTDSYPGMANRLALACLSEVFYHLQRPKDQPKIESWMESLDLHKKLIEIVSFGRQVESNNARAILEDLYDEYRWLSQRLISKLLESHRDILSLCSACSRDYQRNNIIKLSGRYLKCVLFHINVPYKIINNASGANQESASDSDDLSESTSWDSDVTEVVEDYFDLDKINAVISAVSANIGRYKELLRDEGLGIFTRVDLVQFLRTVFSIESNELYQRIVDAGLIDDIVRIAFDEIDTTILSIEAAKTLQWIYQASSDVPFAALSKSPEFLRRLQEVEDGLKKDLGGVEIPVGKTIPVDSVDTTVFEVIKGTPALEILQPIFKSASEDPNRAFNVSYPTIESVLAFYTYLTKIKLTNDI